MDRCDAPLRKKPGQTCRAPALRKQQRCRLHAGRPKGSGSPEGRAATRAGHAAYYAKYRAAKARGEPVRLRGGRRKRWLIPRWWRFALPPEDQARVLLHMVEHDARVRGGQPRPPWQAITSDRIEAKALARFENTFILCCNDPVAPLSQEEADKAYASIYAVEQSLNLSGADVRISRLAWERQQIIMRDCQKMRLELDRLTGATPASPLPSAAPVERQSRDELEPPWDSFREAIAPPTKAQLRAEIDDRKRLLARCNLPESSARRLADELADARGEAAQLAVLDRWLARMERAYAMTEAAIGHYIDRAEARDEGRRPRRR